MILQVVLLYQKKDHKDIIINYLKVMLCISNNVMKKLVLERITGGGCLPSLRAPTSGALVGRQTAPTISTPVSACWPEEEAWRAAVVRRSRCGRR